MTHTLPNPTLAAFHSGGSVAGSDAYPIEVVGVGNWSGPGAGCVTVAGHLRTRPTA